MKTKSTRFGKNSLSRAERLPASRYDEDKYGNRSIRKLFDRNAREGAYKVDACAAELKKRGLWKSDDAVRAARGMIEVAGARAIEMAHAELVKFPQASAKARIFNDAVEAARAALAAVPRASIAEIATVIAIDVDATSGDELRRPGEAIAAAEAVLEQLIAGIAQVEQGMSAFSVKYGEGALVRAPNYDPLTNWFIDIVAMFWLSEAESWPTGKSRKYFVRLLAAGWEDLGLPTEDNKGNPRGTLESWFSSRLEKRKLIGKDW